MLHLVELMESISQADFLGGLADLLSHFHHMNESILYDVFHLKRNIVLDRPSQILTKLFFNFI
jgi:hypothetical protein